MRWQRACYSPQDSWLFSAGQTKGDIMPDKVIYFKRFPFKTGQKIHISDGPRKGDWEVEAVTDKKVSLRCPVSGHRVEWNRFCYFADEREAEWPAE